MSFLSGALSTIGGAVGGPAGAAIGGAVGNAVGGKKKKKKKGGAAADAAGAVQSAASELAAMAGGHISPSDAINHARGALAAAPEQIRQAVRDVARELQAGRANRAQTVEAIQSSPEVREIVGAVRLSQLQTQATNEHRGIMANEARHRAAAERQQLMLAKLDQLLAKLERTTPVPNRFAAVIGGLPLLNRLR